MIWALILLSVAWFVVSKKLVMSTARRDVFSEIMLGRRQGGGDAGTGTRSGPGSSDFVGGGGGGVAWDLLALFAADVLAGDWLRRRVRSFARRHASLIEFGTGLELDLRRLEGPPPATASSAAPPSRAWGGDRRRRGEEDEATDDEEDVPFVAEVRGLENRGQTCYANSVLQALASLEPLVSYLERARRDANGGGGERRGDDDDVVEALCDVLRRANGRPRRGGSRTGGSILSFAPSSLWRSSSSRDGDPRRVLDRVARRHPQFRCRAGGSVRAGTREQQDSHEFFVALMDSLAPAGEGGGGEGDDRGKGSGGGSEGRSDVVVGRGLAGWDGPGPGDCREEGAGGGAGAEGGGRGSGASASSGPAVDPFPDDLEEEKKHEERPADASDGFAPKRSAAATDGPKREEDPSVGTEPPTRGVEATRAARGRPAAAAASSLPPPAPTLRHPFDGWSGSAVRCASCRHVRPVRSAPFLCLSLPLAPVPSEYLEDLLAAEYGGFSTAERVSDVQCASCAIDRRVRELEEEAALVEEAVASVRRRRKGGKKGGGNGNGRRASDESEDDVAGLVRESLRLRRQIAVLRSLDPDADDDDDNGEDDDDEDAALGIGEDDDAALRLDPPPRVDAHRACLVLRPPGALCVHLQRRHFDPAAGRMVKVVRPVRFEERLDLRSYCAYGENSFEVGAAASGATAGGIASGKGAPVPYRLTSVVEHVGNAFGGHYQTYRRSGRGGWVLVSDECVSRCTWDEVRACQAYMLFYKAVVDEAGPS